MRTLLLLLLALAASLPAYADGPIRVLFLGQEEKNVHDTGAAAAAVMQEFGRDAIYFDYFKTPDCLTPETLGLYDAVLLYSNHKSITTEQFDALNAFVESGKGFLPIHSGSASFINEPRFLRLVGARFKEHGGGVFKATIVDKAHPIMAGVNEYETWDETY
ncbi:MAG: ThuA domain-containing protein, partial [Chthoniobacteraceae bacterium]